jgi:Tfp pilus assembly protein PilF
MAALLERSLPAAAEMHYDRALAHDPSSERALFGKAALLARTGRFKESAALYEKGLNEHPDAYEARTRYGLVLYTMGRMEDALRQYERVVAQAPEYGDVHQNLSIYYWKQGDLDRAEASLARARTLGADIREAFARQLAEELAGRAPGQ